MIPEAAITHWRNVAPWPHDALVEQDLILCRSLVEIFGHKDVAPRVVLRGGTALHKLYAASPLRYSEDIDLVQAAAGPIGELLDQIRSRLDPVLGVPRRERNPDNVTLRYRVESEIPPVVPLRLKVEINTREHFSVYGPVAVPFLVRSPWFAAEAEVRTYTLDELLATKLRALYQRRKGRDLFDLWVGLQTPGIDPRRIVEAFRRYLAKEKARITRTQFEKNLALKLSSGPFTSDLLPLLAPGVPYETQAAARLVGDRLLALL